MDKESVYSLITSTLDKGPTLENLVKWPPLVIFDGECGFCNGCLYWLYKLDKAKLLYFVKANSNVGKRLIHFFQPLQKVNDTVFFISKGNIYAKSEAIIRIFQILQIPLVDTVFLLPSWLRDFFYDYIARNRHYWSSSFFRSCSLEHAQALSCRIIE